MLTLQRAAPWTPPLLQQSSLLGLAGTDPSRRSTKIAANTRGSQGIGATLVQAFRNRNYACSNT